MNASAPQAYTNPCVDAIQTEMATLWSAIIASPRHEWVSAPHTIRRIRDAALDTRPLAERQ